MSQSSASEAFAKASSSSGSSVTLSSTGSIGFCLGTQTFPENTQRTCYGSGCSGAASGDGPAWTRALWVPPCWKSLQVSPSGDQLPQRTGIRDLQHSTPHTWQEWFYNLVQADYPLSKALVMTKQSVSRKKKSQKNLIECQGLGYPNQRFWDLGEMRQKYINIPKQMNKIMKREKKMHPCLIIVFLKCQIHNGMREVKRYVWGWSLSCPPTGIGEEIIVHPYNELPAVSIKDDGDCYLLRRRMPRTNVVWKRQTYKVARTI